MRREAPTNAQSLTQRIDNLCRDQQIPVGRARRLIGIVVVGQLLGQTAAGVVKGASNVEVRVGTANSRASSDFDTVRRETLAQYRADLEQALRVGWYGFTGLLSDQGPIATPGPIAYQPHRFRLKLEFRGGSFTSFTVEVSPEEVGSLDLGEAVPATEAAAWFAALGLPDPQPIPVLPLPHQVAQKLHACTSPDTETWVNDREHDLIDLQLALGDLDRLVCQDLAEFRGPAERLFRARRMHPWPPIVTPRSGWGDAYTQQARGLGVLADLESAVAWTNRLIKRIAEA